jgi:ubiquinone/menaquinone biosynthesis C-methylase UbiE
MKVADAVHSNRAARRAVVDYYSHCDDDYRILWRTDENGSIHFGYFDDLEEASLVARVVDSLRIVPTHLVGCAAALAAAVARATGTAWGRAKSVALLRVAARGHAERHDAGQARMTEVCARAVGLRPGDHVLDAGCGVGGTGLWLAARHGITVVGINVQPHHLEEARRRASAHEAGHRVRFSAQDFTEIGMADETFDVVWALESVCHCEEKARFLAEAYRVLRRGGRLMVADFFLPRRDVPIGDREAMQMWTRGWALPNLATVPGFEQTLQALGFGQVTYRDLRPHVMPSSRRLYKASLVAGPIAAALERLGVRSRIQRDNVRASFYQYRTLRSGAWTYGLFVATK